MCVRERVCVCVCACVCVCVLLCAHAFTQCEIGMKVVVNALIESVCTCTSDAHGCIACLPAEERLAIAEIDMMQPLDKILIAPLRCGQGAILDETRERKQQNT